MDYVDVPALKELESILEEEMPEVMQMYLTTLDQDIQGIEQCLAQGDWEGLRKSAHTLKGSSANVAAKAMSEICAEIERLAKNTDQENAAAAVKRLGPIADRTRETLADLGYS